MDRSCAALLATIVLTLTFVPGCNEELSTNAILSDPVASFTYSGTTVTPASINFQNTSKNSNSYQWDFGDGTLSQDRNPTKIYTIGGVYTVHLIATNTRTGKSNKVAHTINILAGPKASFDIIGDAVTFSPIVFYNTSQYADKFWWSLGEGDTSTYLDPTKTFTVYASYTIRLIATNVTYGKSDTVTRQIVITPGKLFVDSVIVDRVPFVDPTGVPWDSESTIDLEFLLTGAGGGRYYYLFGAPVHDVSPTSLPVSWQFGASGRLDVWNRAYRVGLWDQDVGYPYYIGETNMFMISDTIAAVGYPTLLRLQDHRGTISARIILKWQ
jgi:PKD repeat protein